MDHRYFYYGFLIEVYGSGYQFRRHITQSAYQRSHLLANQEISSINHTQLPMLCPELMSFEISLWLEINNKYGKVKGAHSHIQSPDNFKLISRTLNCLTYW